MERIGGFFRLAHFFKTLPRPTCDKTARKTTPSPEFVLRQKTFAPETLYTLED